jgi:signal peptidase I
MSVLRGATSILGYAVIGVATVLVGLFVLAPMLTGGAALTVLTGSMEPTIPAGSVVLVEPREPAEVEIGDVITFQPAPNATFVTHRVVDARFDASGRRVLTTRGDANPTPDREPVAEDGVAGVVRIHVPYLGYAAQAIDLRFVLYLGAAMLLWSTARSTIERHRAGAVPPTEDPDAETEREAAPSATSL